MAKYTKRRSTTAPSGPAGPSSLTDSAAGTHAHREKLTHRIVGNDVLGVLGERGDELVGHLHLMPHVRRHRTQIVGGLAPKLQQARVATQGEPVGSDRGEAAGGRDERPPASCCALCARLHAEQEEGDGAKRRLHPVPRPRAHLRARRRRPSTSALRKAHTAWRKGAARGTRECSEKSGRPINSSHHWTARPRVGNGKDWRRKSSVSAAPSGRGPGWGHLEDRVKLRVGWDLGGDESRVELLCERQAEDERERNPAACKPRERNARQASGEANMAVQLSGPRLGRGAPKTAANHVA